MPLIASATFQNTKLRRFGPRSGTKLLSHRLIRHPASRPWAYFATTKSPPSHSVTRPPTTTGIYTTDQIAFPTMTETRTQAVLEDEMPSYNSHYVPPHYPPPAAATRLRGDSSASARYTPDHYATVPSRTNRSSSNAYLSPHLTSETGAMATYEPPRPEQYDNSNPSYQVPENQLHPYHPDPYHQGGSVRPPSPGRARGYSSDSRYGSDSGRSQKSYYSSRSRFSDDEDRSARKSHGHRHHQHHARHFDKDADRASVKSHKSHRSHKSSHKDYDDYDDGKPLKRRDTRRPT